MLTDIKEIERSVARKIVTKEGDPCECINQDGQKIKAYEYGGKLWDLEGNPLGDEFYRVSIKHGTIELAVSALLLIIAVVYWFTK